MDVFLAILIGAVTTTIIALMIWLNSDSLYKFFFVYQRRDSEKARKFWPIFVKIYIILVIIVGVIGLTTDLVQNAIE